MYQNKKSLLILIAILLGALFLAWFLVLRGLYHPLNNGASPDAVSSPLSAYSDEERFILRPPTLRPDAPTPDDDQATVDFITTLHRLAQETETLEIGARCAMTPPISRVNTTTTLSLTNTDTVPHTLVFDTLHPFPVTLPPGATTTLHISDAFGSGEGIRYYRCSDVSETDNVGVLYITVPQ